MKLLPLIILLFSVFQALSQNEEFRLKGKLIGADSQPVVDAYIINFRDLKKIVSGPTGEFNIWVMPGDSLMVSHISYNRRKVYVGEVRRNPEIYLDLDTINIFRVDVSPNYKDENELARQNMAFIKNLEVPAFTKIKTESNPVSELVKEHNKIMRNEASSVSILRFSPSEIIGRFFSKKRRK